MGMEGSHLNRKKAVVRRMPLRLCKPRYECPVNISTSYFSFLAECVQLLKRRTTVVRTGPAAKIRRREGDPQTAKPTDDPTPTPSAVDRRISNGVRTVVSPRPATPVDTPQAITDSDVNEVRTIMQSDFIQKVAHCTLSTDCEDFHQEKHATHHRDRARVAYIAERATYVAHSRTQ